MSHLAEETHSFPPTDAMALSIVVEFVPSSYCCIAIVSDNARRARRTTLTLTTFPSSASPTEISVTSPVPISVRSKLPVYLLKLDQHTALLPSTDVALKSPVFRSTTGNPTPASAGHFTLGSRVRCLKRVYWVWENWKLKEGLLVAMSRLEECTNMNEWHGGASRQCLLLRAKSQRRLCARQSLRPEGLCEWNFG